MNPAVYILGASTTGNTASRYALTLANPSQRPKFGGGEGGTTLITSGVNASYNAMVASIQHRPGDQHSLRNKRQALPACRKDQLLTILTMNRTTHIEV